MITNKHKVLRIVENIFEFNCLSGPIRDCEGTLRERSNTVPVQGACEAATIVGTDSQGVPDLPKRQGLKADRHLAVRPVPVGGRFNRDCVIQLKAVWLANFTSVGGWCSLHEIAEAEGHHPDLHIGWGRCGVEIWTHDINGLAESDFFLAAKVNRAHNQRVAVSELNKGE